MLVMVVSTQTCSTIDVYFIVGLILVEEVVIVDALCLAELIYRNLKLAFHHCRMY